MTLIKVCGITRDEDAALACDLGADFLGFVFVETSPRFVPARTAARIVAARHAANARSRFVGVFRNESLATMRHVARAVGLDLVQLHGDEPEAVVSELGVPVIRAFHVREALPAKTDTSADYLLFDSGGGTGRTFDWSLLDGAPRTKPFLLAGGLTPENVSDAIRRVRPDGVDVASGIESAPGIKDPNAMKTFFERVNR